MSAYEIIMIMDIASTMALELWGQFKTEGEPMTKDQFIEASQALQERRKAAIAAIKAHG